MDLKVTIEGLGKISKAEVNLKRLTLFAGRNSAGKTFLSKAIYSALKGASSNHAWNLIGEETQELYKLLAPLHWNNKTPPPVLEELDRIATTPVQFHRFFAEDESAYAERVRDIAEGIDACYKAQDREKAIKELGSAGRISPETDVQKIEHAIGKIKDFAKLSGEEIIKRSVDEKMPQFFIENFRTGKPASLATESGKGFKLTINDCLEVQGKQSQFSTRWTSYSEISDIPWLFYIDALGLKFSSRLIREFSSLRTKHNMVPEIPKYHTDLLDIVEAINLVPDEFLSRILTKVTEIIGGKLEYENGSLVFIEDGVGVHDASVTSSGILQLGLLGLLAEKGLLREGTFLFIDEPEANLHPTWQASITGLLAELALKGNVNIVLATHSPYILQYLKYGAKHDDKFDSILSVNHFADKGINVGIDQKMGNHERLERIEEDLNETYIDISLKSMINA